MCGARLSDWLAAVKVLGRRFGASLFQLPPNMKKDVGRLGAFLELLPKDHPAAFEFRHASWFDDEVFEALRARNADILEATTPRAPPR